MKKILCAVLALFMLVTLTSCGSKPSEPEKTSGEFEPLLDTDTDCSITVAGSYDNFEALEMEFDRFNETYPNVELNYVKLDDYNNVLATALDGNDKPNIFFSYTWMIGTEDAHGSSNARIFLVASRPFISGICISIKIRS